MRRPFIGVLILGCLSVLAPKGWGAAQSFLFSDAPHNTSIGSTIVNNLADANSEGTGCIAQVPKTGTISNIWWTTGTVTTGDTMDVGIETVTTGGLPSGTNYGGSTKGTQVVADADDNVVFTTALGTNATATKGDSIALVVQLPASAVGSLNIESLGLQWTESVYSVTNALATWSKVADGCKMAVQYNDGSYAPMFTSPVAATTMSEQSWNVGSTPDEVGLYFQYPYPVTITGVVIHMEPDVDCDVTLYDSDGTTALDVITNVNERDIVASESLYMLFFDSGYSLSANTAYRISVSGASATNNFLSYFTVDAAAVMDAFPGGQNFQWTQRTDAGAWSQTTTQKPHIYPIVSQHDDAVGGGGAGMSVWGF